MSREASCPVVGLVVGAYFKNDQGAEENSTRQRTAAWMSVEPDRGSTCIPPIMLTLTCLDSCCACWCTTCPSGEATVCCPTTSLGCPLGRTAPRDWQGFRRKHGGCWQGCQQRKRACQTNQTRGHTSTTARPPRRGVEELKNGLKEVDPTLILDGNRACWWEPGVRGRH